MGTRRYRCTSVRAKPSTSKKTSKKKKNISKKLPRYRQLFHRVPKQRLIKQFFYNIYIVHDIYDIVRRGIVLFKNK